jgi:hypothetical protein
VENRTPRSLGLSSSINERIPYPHQAPQKQSIMLSPRLVVLAVAALVSSVAAAPSLEGRAICNYPDVETCELNELSVV